MCRVFGAGDGSRLPGPTPDVDVSTRSAYVPLSPTPPPPPPPSPTAAPHSTRPIVGKITFCNMQNILSQNRRRVRTRLPDRCWPPSSLHSFLGLLRLMKRKPVVALLKILLAEPQNPTILNFSGRISILTLRNASLK